MSTRKPYERDLAARAAPPCVQPGQPLNPCARVAYEQTVGENYHFAGTWKGWRMERGVLIGPGGIRWTPVTLTMAASWQELGFAGAPETTALLERVSRGAGA